MTPITPLIVSLTHRKYSILLMTLVLYVLSYALVDGAQGVFIDNFFLTLVLLWAVNASHERKECSTYIGWSLVIVSIWTSEFHVYLTALNAMLVGLFLTHTTFKFLHRLLRDMKIDLDYLAWAVSGYMLLGVIGGYMWIFINTILPWSFQIGTILIDQFVVLNEHLLFLYRSFSTLTTLWYGDIIPIKSLAISSSILLVLFGQVYLTLLLWIILSKFVHGNQWQKTIN